MLLLCMVCVVNGSVKLHKSPPLEGVISLKFLPALKGRSISYVERSLFSSFTRLGGLGVGDQKYLSDSQFHSSVKVICSDRSAGVLFWCECCRSSTSDKSEVVRANNHAKSDFTTSSLPADLHRIMTLSNKKGLNLGHPFCLVLIMTLFA